MYNAGIATIEDPENITDNLSAAKKMGLKYFEEFEKRVLSHEIKETENQIICVVLCWLKVHQDRPNLQNVLETESLRFNELRRAELDLEQISEGSLSELEDAPTNIEPGEKLSAKASECSGSRISQDLMNSYTAIDFNY